MSKRIAALWRVLPGPARRALTGLAVVSILAAIAELASLAALAAFLARVGRADGDLARPAALFTLAALASGAVRLWMAAKTAALAAETAHELGVEAQRRLIHQSLSFHALSSSARALATIERVQLMTGGALRPAIQLGQSLLIGAFILGALLISTPLTAIAIAAFIALAYAVMARLSWRRIARAQPAVNDGFEQRVRVVQESFGGIRDVILDQLQEQRVSAFAAVDGRLQRAIASVQSLVAAPRFLIEGVGMALIALLILALAERGMATMIPALGLVAFAALKLLPLANAGYASWQGWNANRPVIDEVLEILALPIPPKRIETQPLPFERSVALEAATYSYPGGPPVLDNVSLTLPFGSRTGIIGVTGAGKSTIGDLFMGLIAPDQGALLVDGMAVDAESAPRWQRNVAHVGQHLFLLDASIVANVAFGDPTPDPDAVSQALKRACLEELSGRLDQPVGERGVRLSGGQRQRLALARAFYKRAPFLVLDEATSALDEATERRLLDNLPGNQTILIIGHRPSALAICDRLFEVTDGALTPRS